MIRSAMVTLGLLIMPVVAAATPSIELFKSPDCLCCEAYADYLRTAGFEIAVKATPDLMGMSAAAGIPAGLEGCHLAFVDGYIVSGHVPADVVRRLLEERPEVAGVTLPGMPLGSPGMDGEKSEPFTIYTFGGETPPVVFAVQ